MNDNRCIICQIVQAVVFLAKQGLPFHGDLESIQSKKISGNLLGLLKDYATTNKYCLNRLNSPRAKNATYISPLTQNEIINVTGCDVILSGIVSEVKEACFFSVLADEVGCHIDKD